MSEQYLASLYRGVHNLYVEEKVRHTVEEQYDVALVDRSADWLRRWEELPEWDDWKSMTYAYTYK